MNIHFHGVRGSYPVPGKDTVEYGGNTSCISFTKEFNGKIYRLVIDSGTGIVNLGKEILNNYFDGKEKLNIPILFTHLHPDHTQGFPFFAPNYFSDCSIHLMGMKALKKHIGMVLEQTMLPPTFPIEYKDLRSARRHYELKHNQIFHLFQDGSISDDSSTKKKIFKIEVMQSYAPSHPQQGALYYNIIDPVTNKKVSCIWDIESKQGGDKAVINFTKDCDIMIHDTQYTSKEYNSDKNIVQGFGHSTYEMAIENAIQAKVKEALFCFHFNPNHSDKRLNEIQQDIDEIKTSPFLIKLAKEGMVITEI